MIPLIKRGTPQFIRNQNKKMSWYALVDSNTDGFICLGPAYLESTSPGNATYVIQPNVSARDMSCEVFLFESIEQWMLARDMTSVTGVGWKGAVNIIYGTPWNTWRSFMECKDLQGISRLPGMGGKVGQAILKEVFASPDTVKQNMNEDAVSALKVMGYSATEAKEKVLCFLRENPKASTEDIIIQSLKK